MIKEKIHFSFKEHACNITSNNANQCQAASRNQKSYIFTQFHLFLGRIVPYMRISALRAPLSLHIMQSHIAKLSQTLERERIICMVAVKRVTDVSVSGSHKSFWQLPIPGHLQPCASTHFYKLHSLCVPACAPMWCKTGWKKKSFLAEGNRNIPCPRFSCMCRQLAGRVSLSLHQFLKIPRSNISRV